LSRAAFELADAQVPQILSGYFLRHPERSEGSLARKRVSAQAAGQINDPILELMESAS
jgi:hypothetical protein